MLIKPKAKVQGRKTANDCRTDVFFRYQKFELNL
jgi:hypothetical protein